MFSMLCVATLQAEEFVGKMADEQNRLVDLLHDILKLNH